MVAIVKNSAQRNARANMKATGRFFRPDEDLRVAGCEAGSTAVTNLADLA
jgi:hypothetical protein